MSAMGGWRVMEKWRLQTACSCGMASTHVDRCQAPNPKPQSVLNLYTLNPTWKTKLSFITGTGGTAPKCVAPTQDPEPAPDLFKRNLQDGSALTFSRLFPQLQQVTRHRVCVNTTHIDSTRKRSHLTHQVFVHLASISQNVPRESLSRPCSCTVEIRKVNHCVIFWL